MIRIAYAIVVLIWATTPLSIQWSSQGLSPFFGAALRILIAFIVSVLWVRTQNIHVPMTLAAIKLYCAAVVGLCFALLCVYWGSRYISSGLVSIIFGLAPLMTGVLAYQFFKESLNIYQCLSIAGAVLGLGIVFSDDLAMSDLAYRGIIAVLMATLFFCVSNILVKRLGEGVEIHPMAMTVGSLGFALPIYIICFIWSGIGFDSEVFSIKTIGAIVYLGIFGSVVAPFCYFMVLKKMSANVVSLITVMTPVLAIFLGTHLNGELVGLQVYVGTGLILVSLIFYNLKVDVSKGGVSAGK